MKVLVPLANGFEELEAITIVDVFRRAEISVSTAAVAANPVKGSHDIPVYADTVLNDLNMVDFNAIVLPGGMPGSKNLMMSDRVQSFIKHIYSKGGYAAALCAGPIALAQAGILYGKKATCFPGFEKDLKDATIIDAPVVVDGTVITGKGPGCAMPFALELVRIFKGEQLMNRLIQSMQVYWM